MEGLEPVVHLFSLFRDFFPSRNSEHFSLHAPLPVGLTHLQKAWRVCIRQGKRKHIGTERVTSGGRAESLMEEKLYPEAAGRAVKTQSTRGVRDRREGVSPSGVPVSRAGQKEGRAYDCSDRAGPRSIWEAPDSVRRPGGRARRGLRALSRPAPAPHRRAPAELRSEERA